MNQNELTSYHFNNYYGESDSKIHEKYWISILSCDDVLDLKEAYKEIMLKAGSWNSNQIGYINALVKILNGRDPNWRDK